MKTCKTIVFDLSEVLIKGLMGMENYLEPILNLDKTRILRSFGGPNLRSLFIGSSTEDQYIQTIISNNNLTISSNELKKIFRNEFSHVIDGMSELVVGLAKSNSLVLYSDHAREWVSYILEKHTFLNLFDRLVFSYDQKCLKSEDGAFTKLLTVLNLECSDVIFIDDTIENIRNAERCGIETIHFRGSDDLKMNLCLKLGLNGDELNIPSRH